MSWVEFIHYGTSRATAEAVVLAKEVLAASLDRLRVFGSTICVEMTMLEFVDCGDHFERLRECETKMDDLCRPFEAHIAHLDTVTGVDQRAAQDALAEIGMDMSHFPSYKHLSSWARICPGNTESAGKRKRGQTGKGDQWVRAILVQSAHAAGGTTDTYLRAQYRRFARRRGKKRATVVVALNSILDTLYFILRDQVSYQESGPN